MSSLDTYVQPGRKRKSSSSGFLQSSSSTPPRVVLLIDLDCFYAQCECVRLGYNPLETPLALMQWNSALAVTYPARALGIQRGDSWQSVAQKSQGKCLAVHVPITERAATAANAAVAVPPNPDEGEIATAAEGDAAEEKDSSPATTDGEDFSPATAGDEYDRNFRLSPERRDRARLRDLNVRRYPEEGKACIERYRIASRKILETVKGCLASSCCDVGKHGSGGSFTLERASIDEFYVELTDACARAATALKSRSGTTPTDWEEAVRDTNVIGSKDERADRDTSELQQDGSDDIDEATIAALRHGSRLAWKLRQTVRAKLGFTLSAGIAPNKLLAKLSASYGKPNGQAVLFPQFVPWLLDRTDIRKCRNLGGKLGKRVQALLPPDVPATVGSLARYMSFGALTHDAKLPSDTARWLLEYVRGIDPEAVQQESVVKTITAFKNLNRHPQLPDCASWFQLLVEEIVTRVERDAACHHRYPRFYHVQYRVHDPTNTKRIWRQSSKGWKAGFPGYILGTEQKVQEIFSKILPAIAAKEKDRLVRLASIGLSAVDFVDRPASKGGRNFFACGPIADSTSRKRATGTEFAKNGTGCEVSVEDRVAREVANDKVFTRRLQGVYNGENRTLQAIDARTQSPTQPAPGSSTGDLKPPRGPVELIELDDAPVAEDLDMKLAKRLQAEYDREDRIIQALERQKKREVTSKNKVKTGRIDSFFKRNSAAS